MTEWEDVRGFRYKTKKSAQKSASGFRRDYGQKINIRIEKRSGKKPYQLQYRKKRKRRRK